MVRPGGEAVTVTTGATRSIVHAKVAGLDTLPDGPVAVTVKVWLPPARAEYACGLVHAAGAAESRAQVKVEPAWLEVKEKLAVDWLVRVAGEEVMVTTGAARSIVQASEAGLDVLPAGSVAVTEKVWLPAARPEYACGLVHAAAAAESSAQLKVEPAWLELKERLAVV